MLATLSVEDVLKIHEILVADFAAADDPISPAGLHSMSLLESAVGRQKTGLRGRLKYPDPISNAATLLFGICNNHPFHNGNKRTALVAMLAHLDKNNLSVRGTRQKDLFDFMMRVASHELLPRRRRHKFASTADQEVKVIADWIRSRASRRKRGERRVTFRQLRRILSRFGFRLEHGSKGNTVDVVHDQPKKVGILRKVRLVRKRVGTIGYHDEGTVVAIRDLKAVRRMCGLTESDGVDSGSFYDGDAVLDGFVNEYRGVLRRLAKR